MHVKIKKLHPDARIPEKTYEADFCYDCYAVSEEEVAPNVWRYGLGFAMEIDDIYEQLDPECLIGVTARPRSSIWKTGMILSNAPGTIDEIYRGQLYAVFYHVMTDMPRYKVGDKICQIHLSVTTKMEFREVDKLSETERGSNGFGSTGK